MALRLDFTHSLRSFAAAVSLTVEPGTTTALVGPSGAGKTTVLRVASGLLQPDRGRVALGDDVWLDTVTGVDLPPECRSVGYVFQEYALFPHLDVLANVRFGTHDPTRVDEILERFRITHLSGARIGELSGGERLRVALARALVRRPGLLLLDEPLSALDAHTKATVRIELHELLDELDIPTILVTHDFEDAAALADSVGVIVEGTILQSGTAAELVAAPTSPFVASFTGATLLAGTATTGADGLTEVVLDTGGTAWSTDAGSGRVNLAVYPWEVSLSRELAVDSAVNHVRAPISSIIPLGNRARIRVGPIVADVTGASADRLQLREGEVVFASFKATATRILPLQAVGQ